MYAGKRKATTENALLACLQINNAESLISSFQLSVTDKPFKPIVCHQVAMIPHRKTVDEDLNEAAREVMVGTSISLKPFSSLLGLNFWFVL